MMNEKVKAKIDLLTSKPGVYLMKDNEGKIIYVGKAKSLIKRVKQYFLRPQEGKVFRMVREVDDFDTIETLNEKEALLLEINLIIDCIQRLWKCLVKLELKAKNFFVIKSFLLD